MAFNLFETPKLTKPVQVYDPSKSVQENMNGQGQPSAQNIISAYQTPQAQLQLQQGQQQTTPVKTTLVVDPNSATSGMDAVIANMYTSPEQEEKMRKASVANQRILAIGDALRHIGNIYNTVNYAPSQQFNKPLEEEQTRYEKGKAVRDAANARYLSYQQQKAAQDAKQKQWEMDFQLKLGDAARKAGYTEAQIQNMKDRLAQQKAYQDANIALGQRRADDAKAANEARIKELQRHNKVSEGQGWSRINETKRHNSVVESRTGGGSTVAPLATPKGKVRPNAANYSNQLLQIWDFASTQGLVSESDVNRRLRELGFGKDQSDNVKQQQVMSLLRNNQDIGDYAVDQLGWSYENGGSASGKERIEGFGGGSDSGKERIEGFGGN